MVRRAIGSEHRFAGVATHSSPFWRPASLPPCRFSPCAKPAHSRRSHSRYVESEHPGYHSALDQGLQSCHSLLIISPGSRSPSATGSNRGGHPLNRLQKPDIAASWPHLNEDAPLCNLQPHTGYGCWVCPLVLQSMQCRCRWAFGQCSSDFRTWESRDLHLPDRDDPQNCAPNHHSNWRDRQESAQGEFRPGLFVNGNFRPL